MTSKIIKDIIKNCYVYDNSFYYMVSMIEPYGKLLLGREEREKLLETGIRIFEFRPDAAERKKIMTGELQLELDHKPIFGLHAKPQFGGP